jgi:hypothetical protein
VTGAAPIWRVVLVLSLEVMAASALVAQGLPPEGDTRHSMLREAMLGLLSGQATVPENQARGRCITLPDAPPNDRIQGPHGDSLLTSHCEVVQFQPLGPDSAGQWFAAQYRWTSLFNAEDTNRGPAARDTVIEEEAVVLARAVRSQVRPVWHARFETGASAIWRSVTPELAPTPSSTLVLSVMSCVNGTGGCSQEFLQRHLDGHWAPVWQVWYNQLPAGFSGRIRHGVRIEPRTLRGEAGFYGPRDANCCPSERLRVQLGLQGDSLTLRRYAVVQEAH